MTENPYHHPETAAAIWNVAMNAGLQRAHARQLLDLIEGVDLAGQKAQGQTIARSLEIVLSRVKMQEPMRRDAMWALARERNFARARAATGVENCGGRYSGAGDLSAGVPNTTDPERRGFNPC